MSPKHCICHDVYWSPPRSWMAARVSVSATEWVGQWSCRCQANWRTPIWHFPCNMFLHPHCSSVSLFCVLVRDHRIIHNMPLCCLFNRCCFPNVFKPLPSRSPPRWRRNSGGAVLNTLTTWWLMSPNRFYRNWMPKRRSIGLLLLRHMRRCDWCAMLFHVQSMAAVQAAQCVFFW